MEDVTTIGVVIVSYESGDVIEACLKSLADTGYPDLRIVVSDNASPDDTVELVRQCSRKLGFAFTETDPEDTLHRPGANSLTLLRGPVNAGFAAAANRGIECLRRVPDVALFWILNPDSEADPAAPRAYADRAREVGEFSIMGGRTVYHGEGGVIQADGGRVSLWTGVCHIVHRGVPPDTVDMPSVDSLNFIAGANMVASRAFVERVGGMREDYFLYYEEVDWAMRRGDLPLQVCPGALVRHHGGTAIGTGSVSRLPSPFAMYFIYRNRILFVARFNPIGLPVAYVYASLQILKLLLQGGFSQAVTAFRAIHMLPAPRGVKARISSDAHPLAFGGKSVASS